MLKGTVDERELKTRRRGQKKLLDKRILDAGPTTEPWIAKTPSRRT